MALKRALSEAQWFHAIDFGEGLVSPGRFEPGRPPNHSLYGVQELLADVRLQGATAVDVGTMDGLTAFMLAKLGAAKVIATDLARRQTFEVGREALGLTIDYRVPLPVLDLEGALADQRVDLIVLAGVLYHVLDPLTVLAACRRCLRVGGYLILESSYLFDDGRPHLSFNPTDRSRRAIERANVFWRPTKAAIEGMLQMVGFQVLSSIAVDGRIAVLAEARRPSDIDGRTDCVASIHDTYSGYANYQERFDPALLESRQEDAATVQYRGPRGDRRIYPALYRPRVPLQPPWEPSREIDRVRSVAQSLRFHAGTLRGRVTAWLTAR
ncbi:MAG: DUF1698 domain-containing protein [Deltaproteobacteria bacterium]|nr:DUF1698 domain-containing protein [Deltaproteobacteria bacterium]MBW2531221.1 DUF1698 domain-containing protein [Deltaproteobacteria bacterium]